MEVFSVVLGVVGVVGIVYTVYYGRRSQKKKLMVYEVSRPIVLAQAFSPEDDYKLSVLLERKGSTTEKIDSVYTTFLKFANLGKETIRGNDIAPANPLRVTAEGSRILDMRVAGITRKVNNVVLRNQVMDVERASAYVDFDFLDYQDGALVKILSVRRRGNISLEGDIIGMPEGIKNIEEIHPGSKTRDISAWWLLGGLIVAVFLSGFIFYKVIGDWRSAWLMIVPLGLVAAVVALLLLIEDPPWSKRKSSFPKSLDLPGWGHPFVSPLFMARRELLEMEMREADTSRKKSGEEETKGGEN
jgi:hypothetical protein